MGVHIRVAGQAYLLCCLVVCGFAKVTVVKPGARLTKMCMTVEQARLFVYSWHSFESRYSSPKWSDCLISQFDRGPVVTWFCGSTGCTLP